MEFNYAQILWESGEASGGDVNGLGGDSARVGFSNGIDTAFELPGSAVNGAFLDSGPAATSLIQNSLNSSVLGRYIFRARDGRISTQDSTAEFLVQLSPPSATTVTAVGLAGAGLLTFPQALGIILGANVGTTVTGWIVALIGFKFEIFGSIERL